jgi:hypothetical protein
VNQDAITVPGQRRGDHHGAAALIGHPHVGQDRLVKEPVQFGPVGDREFSHAGQCRVGHGSDAIGLPSCFGPVGSAAAGASVAEVWIEEADEFVSGG